VAQPFQPPERFNLYDYLLEARLREGRGDHVALRLPEGDLTYAEVAQLAERHATALAAAGVRREERVMIALPDGAAFVGAMFGILRLGAVAVMVNPQLSAVELAGLLEYVAPTLACVDAAQLGVYREAAATAPCLENGLIVHGEPADPSSFENRLRRPTTGASDILKEGGGAPPVAATHRDDPALWLFSGGTTGRPKAVIQPHRSFANTTELYAKRTLGYGPGDITISVPKLFFGYATGSNLFFPFSVGGSAVLFPEAPTPALLFEKIARHRPTILINVPTFVQKMVAQAAAMDGDEGASRIDLSSLRLATSAGEALSPELYRRWSERFGVDLLDGLGTAEMWHIFVTNRPGEVRPGTLGRVVDGFELSVRDADGVPLPTGELGRLWVRGGSRAHGYWRNSEQTAESFRGEDVVGGDLIRLDEDGFVHYGGRADDVLKVGGRWLVPAEVEDVLARHPAVRECAVIGVADAAGLMKPYAFVLADEDAPADLEEVLRAHVLGHLAAYKHPRRVIVLDAFPRTHLGKIDRGQLRRLIVG
jgi:benzoate-CoA ligase family protein